MDTYSVYINGQLVPSHAATLSVFDHGLLYGDGVLEELRARDGGIFRLHEHLDNLFQSAEALSLAPPLSRETLAHIVLDVCRANQLRDAYIRVLITRGADDASASDPDVRKVPNVIVMAMPLAMFRPAATYRSGVRLATVPSRIMPEIHRFSVRRLSYLARAIGKRMARDKGADESLFLDTRGLLTRGYVSETTSGAVFIVRQGSLVTPPTNNCFDSVTRRAVMETAIQQGVRVGEEPLLLSDVYKAEEIFIADTAIEIIPVLEVDHIPVGDGAPGPVTRRLADAYERYVHAQSAPLYPAPSQAA